MVKLTLSIDERIVARAKKFAASRGLSVSKLVEQYLDVVSRPPRAAEDTPVLARLRGTLTGAEAEEHRAHLRRKYR